MLFARLGCCFCGLVLAGCGGPELRVVVEGQVTWDGQPYAVAPGEQVMLNLLELKDDGQTGNQTFPAVVADNGTFKVPGPEGKGIPPGKYRVSAVSMPFVAKTAAERRDKFNGAFSAQKSPLTVQISATANKPTLELKK